MKSVCVQRLKLNFSKVCRNTAIMPENMSIIPLKSIFLAQGFITRVQGWWKCVGRLTLDRFHVLKGRVFLTANTPVSWGETREEAVLPLWVSHPTVVLRRQLSLTEVV